MDLPSRFAYGPPWRHLLVLWLIGSALVIFARLHWVAIGVAVLFGFIPLALAFMGTIRRLFYPKFLVLETDALRLPVGPLVIRIAYGEILRTSEFCNQRVAWFQIGTREGSFRIYRAMLSDRATYQNIRDFIQSRVSPAAKESEATKPAEPGKFGFVCSYEGIGSVFTSNGAPLWRFKTLHAGKPHYPYGLFRIPDFVVYDLADRELYRFKLVRKLALSKFVMLENGATICTITLRSFLRNKYTLDFADGRKWLFRIPLFGVRISCQSETGDKILAHYRGHNVWQVQLEPPVDDPRLVAALAFLHRERLRFN